MGAEGKHPSEHSTGGEPLPEEAANTAVESTGSIGAPNVDDPCLVCGSIRHWTHQCDEPQQYPGNTKGGKGKGKEEGKGKGKYPEKSGKDPVAKSKGKGKTLQPDMLCFKCKTGTPRA